MTRLPPRHPLSEVLRRHLGPPESGSEYLLERLRASRPVFRFFRPDNGHGLVGKFYTGPALHPLRDQCLTQEYATYRAAPARGLAAAGVIPRLVGAFPGMGLGLLLEAVPGPDLDYFLGAAAQGREPAACGQKIGELAKLLAFFHTRPVPSRPVSPEPAAAYFRKLLGQLQTQGLLSPEETSRWAAAGRSWEDRWAAHHDGQVLLHGDATPTNVIFPEGRAVAVDLERLRLGDRLFDLSWVAGELRHAWGWRGRDFADSEGFIQDFFRTYIEALGGDPALAGRIYTFNPFYMALAELRIARNAYLAWDYRRRLVQEAWRCFTSGGNLS